MLIHSDYWITNKPTHSNTTHVKTNTDKSIIDNNRRIIL